MVNLMFRSILVLALLFGLLFAVGMAVIVATGAPVWLAVVFALAVVFLQYLLGPFILELIYKIEWLTPEQLDPTLAKFIRQVCAQRGIPVPRMGRIDDGNPNAFTFGHWPGDARLVITRGIQELLTPEEQQAVVAHELGHIAHWDFVVMTLAASVPLVLYTLYVATSRGGEKIKKGKAGDYLALVALASYVAYILSYFIVLLLSRVREYFADQFSSQITGNPDLLASALVKIAYGLAQAPQAEAKKDDQRMFAARALGIFDPKGAQALALVGAGTGQVSQDAMSEAMKWDLWNPWAGWYELASSHPLPAKRIRTLEKQAQAMGKVSRYAFRKEQPESYWDEFLFDLGVMQLPLLGAVFGGILALAGGAFLRLNPWGMFLLVLGLFWWLQLRRVYPPRFDEKRTVSSLIGEVKVSQVRPIPCTVQGEIIGRGVPGLFFSEDLVLQDDTGFIILDYRQPLGFLEFLFGWLKAGELIGRKGVAKGWYRRAPRPVFEMREMTLEDGMKVTSYQYPFQRFLVYALIAAGVVILGLGVLA